MTDWIVQPATRPLAGTVSVPGDKSIGHRALLLGALGCGPSRVEGLSGGEDNRRTMEALRALGVRVEDDERGVAVVHGVGLDGLRAPAEPIDCGNSGTSMRLLAGVLAAQPFSTTLVGDEYLTRRPMRRVAEPLTLMGARVAGAPGSRPGELYPPLVVGGGSLHGIAYRMPVTSAQVKSALLLAGLFARGVTEVSELGPSRDHTERILACLGAPISRPGAGVVRIDPSGWDRRLAPGALSVPGDPSSAAFLLAAGIVTGGEVLVRCACVNPTRTGCLDALRVMGACIDELARGDVAGEPVADVRAVGAGPEGLVGVELAGDVVVRAIDEIPILAVVAACARGTTVVRDASELRVKESDRVATTVAMLRALGVEAEELADGLVVRGRAGRRFAAADIDAAGDHRIAMSAAVAALAADGECRVRGVDNVATSFPGFTGAVAAIGGEIRQL